jgi:hypothetical protein
MILTRPRWFRPPTFARFFYAGDSSVVQYPNVPALQFTSTQAVSIEGWVNLWQTSGGTMPVVGQGYTSGRMFTPITMAQRGISIWMGCWSRPQRKAPGFSPTVCR